MEVTDVVPNEAVIWHVVENYFSFADSAAEWVGTDLVFNIVPTSKGTEVTFTHVGLVPAAKCYSVSSSAWTDAILGSLQQLITTGKGSVNAA